MGGIYKPCNDGSKYMEGMGHCTHYGLLMEQRDIIGGRLCLGLALGSNAGMTMGPALGLFMGPPDGIGYGPGEGNQYGINMGVDEENILGQNKGRGGCSNAGIWPLYIL